jgi:YVTN family beta-propeller protein
MLEFRILGPLEVLDDGRRIALGGPRQRAVLAVLLLHRGDVVSVDRLIDLVWSDRPPATAVKTLQVYVSHLRRALGDGVVVTASGGYSLAVEAERVDALRFERLVSEGHSALASDGPERAAELLRSALALWRGPALGDLAYETFARDAVARLDELRLAAVEERVEADLQLGRHRELVGELEGLVREHPLRERLRGQQMLALYRSGRQADALESYRRARRALTDELGIEPGRELRRLEHAILTQDPALDPPRVRGDRHPVGRRIAVPLAAVVALAAAAIAAVVLFNGSDRDAAVPPNAVAMIDAASGRVVAAVPVGARPEALAADEQSIWVANVADGTVSQLDPAKRRVVATIAPDTTVEGLVTGGGSVWISDSRRGRAVRLDPEFKAVAETVRFPTTSLNPLPTSPSAAAFGRSSLWVANPKVAAVFKIDTERGGVGARVDVGNDPAGIAVGDDAVWVADGADNTVSRIAPTGAVTNTIPLGNGPGPIAVGADAVWVANTRDDTVSRIDPATRSVVAAIPVGRLPTGVAVGAGSAWVANALSGTVSRIDPRTNRVAETIELGGAPHSVAVADGRVWVSVQEAPPRLNPGGGPAVARVLFDRDSGTTDPALDVDVQRQHATCARLMTYAGRGASGAAELVPELAAAPPAVSADGRVYTFRIRAGYRFSPPSNRPVDAAAFARAIERVLHPRTRSFAAVTLDDVVGAVAYRTGRAATVAGVTARGDRLTITLKRPSPTLSARMATFPFCAVPVNTPIRPEGVERVPSAGPYYVASHAPGRRLVLRRNPGYPGPRPQRLREIEIAIGATNARALAAVEGGRADYTRSVAPDAQARLIARYGPASRAAASGRQRYFSGSVPAVQSLIFNPRRPLFARAALRRAVNHAIDRRALAGRPRPPLLAGRPSDQHLPPGFPGFRDAAIYPLGKPNLAEARRLAGGGRRRGVLYTCNLAECLEHAGIVRANLAAIGIELEVRRFSFSELFRRLESPGEPFDLSLWGWAPDIPDPADPINAQLAFAAIAGSIDRGRLAQRMRATSRLEGAERMEAYGALDRDIAARAAPLAPYLSATSTDFFSARMGCQIEHPLYGIDLAALCVRP